MGDAGPFLRTLHAMAGCILLPGLAAAWFLAGPRGLAGFAGGVAAGLLPFGSWHLVSKAVTAGLSGRRKLLLVLSTVLKYPLLVGGLFLLHRATDFLPLAFAAGLAVPGFALTIAGFLGRGGSEKK
jgi:hypothetical protein